MFFWTLRFHGGRPNTLHWLVKHAQISSDLVSNWFSWSSLPLLSSLRTRGRQLRGRECYSPSVESVLPPSSQQPRGVYQKPFACCRVGWSSVVPCGGFNGAFWLQAAGWLAISSSSVAPTCGACGLWDFTSFTVTCSWSLCGVLRLSAPVRFAPWMSPDQEFRFCGDKTRSGAL